MTECSIFEYQFQRPLGWFFCQGNTQVMNKSHTDDWIIWISLTRSHNFYFICFKLQPQNTHYLFMEDELYREILQAETKLSGVIKNSLNSFKDDLIASTAKFSKSYEARETMNSYLKVGMEKEFTMKEPLLTNLMEITDYKTIYNMVAASLIPLTILLIVDNLSKHGQMLDFQTLSSCFSGGEKIFVAWWLLAIINYSIICLVKAIFHFNLPKSIWVPIYCTIQFSLIYIPMRLIVLNQPGLGCRMAIVMEGSRMIMKAHSYLRNKLLYCTNNKYKEKIPQFIIKNSKTQNIKTPTFNVGDFSTEIKRYTYFFIAPTLIYRDQYTLAPKRRFAVIFFNIFNFSVCIFYSFMLYVVICKPVIEEVGSKQLNWTNLLLGTLKIMLPSSMFLMFMFFGFLHSWQNAWAEITRFPDRTFYLDWWNSIEFGEYYRKWNIVVHDWLYYYVYLDLLKFVFNSDNYRKYTRLFTFLLSAIFHEIIIMEAVGFFYPVLFIIFTGPGIILIENKRRMKMVTTNLFFWIQMYIGTSIIFMLYLMEYLARARYSDSFVKEKWGIWHYFIPRTIYMI